MPKFGSTWFGGYYYGDDRQGYMPWRTSIGNINLGFNVRRQLGKRLIFRYRRGNGYGGAISGRFYQDKYKYFVPPSINNPEGQAARDALAAAVHNWKYVFTPAQRQAYNSRVQRHMNMTGFNLYVKEYIRATV